MLRAYKPFSLLRTSLVRYKPVTRILLFKQMSTKTEQEWKVVLTPEQFRVLREKGTERPGSGEYNKFNKKGKKAS
ncbi:hypothetical protein EDC94DRAFT_629245 [Helicostylum pulchrum]|nr:hypothetical protein EDC94DRAFT_629245 [Helicostylum pulchrum]